MQRRLLVVLTGCFGLGILLVACMALATGARAQEARMALVVGIGNYKAVPVLHNPPRDARAVAAKLRGLGFQADLVVDPDRAGLERAIRAFGDKARKADVALVYYAGHALESGGQNYLLPATADLHSARDIPFETVSLDLIPAQLEGTAHTVLLFIDACRDDPFVSRIATSQRGIASHGLAAASASATGTLIVYATAPGQTADDGSGDDSPFTTALLHHLDEPGLEVRQMLSRVRRDVRNATNGTQIPWESSSLEGDFYFRPAALTATEPLRIPPPATNVPPLATVVPPANPGAAVKSTQEAMVRPPATIAETPRSVDPTLAKPVAPASPQATLSCEVPRFTGMTTGAGALATIRVVNTGNRCGVRVTQPGSFPFSSLSLTTSPVHGEVAIERSAFYYTPAGGFVGTDEFTIVSSPTGSVKVSVTVLPPEALQR
jgi:hypothetical protein